MSAVAVRLPKSGRLQAVDRVIHHLKAVDETLRTCNECRSLSGSFSLADLIRPVSAYGLAVHTLLSVFGPGFAALRYSSAAACPFSQGAEKFQRV